MSIPDKGTKGYIHWKKRKTGILSSSIFLFLATTVLVAIKCIFHFNFEDPSTDCLAFVFGLAPICVYITLIIPLLKDMDFENITRYGTLKSIIGVIPSVCMCVLPFIFDPMQIAVTIIGVFGWIFIFVMFVLFCLAGVMK